MENSYKVIISQKASQMLVSHVAYLAQVNPGAAKHLATEFEKKANSLSFMPLRCPWLSGEYIPSHKYRYLLFLPQVFCGAVICIKFSRIILKKLISVRMMNLCSN